MRFAALSILVSAAVLWPLSARADRIEAPARKIVLAGGTDIIRILPPEASPPPSPTPVVDPRPETKVTPTPPPPPVRPPEKRFDRPVEQGRFVNLQVNRSVTQTDQSRPWIGVSVDNLDRALAISLGLKSANGVLVLEAYPGGAASQAGMKSGDVVVSFNGAAVSDVGDFRTKLLAISPGSGAPVEVWRFLGEGADFVSSLRSMAEQGNAAVMYRLGQMYARGTGVVRDEAEAARWLRQAANAGNTAAMADLGQMLLEGRGVAQNTTEGLSLLKSAADGGSVAAMWQYGQVLQAGKYVTRDLGGAADLYLRSAEGGYHPAMFSIAYLNANGMGMPRNYQQAARWYEKAVEHNNPSAMVNLGLLYQNGNGVEKSDNRAYDLYKRAAELNHPTGMHNLAVLLDKGQGTRRDSEQAADLILRALRAKYDFSYKQMLQNGGTYTREFRVAMQRRLQEAGAYSGPLDGNFGQTTQAAITTYFNSKH